MTQPNPLVEALERIVDVPNGTLAIYDARNIAAETLASHRAASTVTPQGAGWQTDMENVPFLKPVIVQTMSGCVFRAHYGETTEDGDGRDCDTWAAEDEGIHPPCWTDGLCWASNEDGEPSDQPVKWLLPAPTGEEG